MMKDQHNASNYRQVQHRITLHMNDNLFLFLFLLTNPLCSFIVDDDKIAGGG